MPKTESKINLAWVYYWLGWSVEKQRRYDDAVQVYREAIRLGPYWAKPYSSLGGVLNQQGKLAEAAVALREAVRLNPVDYEMVETLAVILDREGKREEARIYWLLALKVDPDKERIKKRLAEQVYEAHYNRGVALRKQGETEVAIKEYREAIRLKPDYAKAHNCLGVALLMSKGRTVEEILEYNEVIRSRRDMQPVRDGWVEDAYADPGKKEVATKEFREAVHLNPDYAEAHLNLGAMLYGVNPEDAMKEYREAIRANPGYAKAHFYLGAALGVNWTTEEEIAEYREAIRLKPDYGQAYIELAMTLDRKGRRKEARQYWEKALEEWPYKVGSFHYGTTERIKQRLAEPD